MHRLIVLLLGIFLVLPGCTSMRPIELQDPVAELEIGDKVRITTKSGERHSFKVTAIDPEWIGGKEDRVSIDSIALIEVKRINMAKTAGVGAGIGAVWIIVGIIAVIGASAGFMSGP